MKRRFTLLAIATFLSTSLMAQWDGSSTEEPSKVDGKYQIDSEAKLAWIAEQIKNKSSDGTYFSGEVFEQTADLDLGNHTWTPIGNNKKLFGGTYDGCGFVIKNIYYNDPTKEYVGLFGGINNAILKNITLASGFVYGYQYAGGICGYAKGNTKIECCTNIATVYGKMERNGGVVAYIQDKVEVTDCINFGLISAFNFSGGVIGFNSKSADVKVTNCVNVGQVFCMRNTAGNLYGYDKGFTGITLNCYYDNQINTSLGRTSTPNIIETNTDEGGVIEGKATSDMIGNGLKTLLGETNWVFDDGMYPRLRTSAQKDAVIVAATPIIIDNSDKADNITSGFSVSKVTGVTWTSGNTDNLVINEDGTTTIKRSTAIVLTATKGGYTKNVYIKTNKAGATSIGSIESPLTIESEQDLIDLRNAVNTYGLYKGCANYDGFKGIHFKQTVNIALTNWTEPISAHNSFKGHYDGNNNEISGININQGTLAIVGGLFGCASHGSINNLSITSGSIIGLKDVGGICGATFCETITNCTVSKGCTVSTGVFNEANIEVGGIVGVDKGFSTIEDCYNYSNVTSYRYSGGIIGRCNQEFVATRCKNYGEIETKSSNAGGICGNVINKDDKFDYCENHGTIKATTGTIGGIIGSQDTDVANCLISNCINSGEITGGTNGGIIGQNGGTITIENCLNLGSVSGGNGIGGGSNATIRNCFNAGAATNGIASGGTIENCINIGKVTSATGCYNDRQMSPIGDEDEDEDEYNTNDMLGNNLQTNLGTEKWSFTDGLYPMIKTLANSDYMIVAATPISLASSETVDGVSTAFTYETSNSLEWSCNEHNFVSFINGTAYPANPNAVAEDVVVIVSKGKASKKIGMKINQSNGTATAIDNWPETLEPIEYNTPITQAMLTATEQNGYDSQGKGVIRYSVEENQILHAGIHYITATFIPNETSGLMPSTKTATLEVRKKIATLEWNPAADTYTYTYGASDNNSKIESAVAKVDDVAIEGTFTYHIPALEAGDRIVEITSFESTNYKLSDTEILTRTIYVNKADASMSWSLAPIDYGTAISDIQLGGFSSYGTISYTYENDGSDVTKGVVLPAGSYNIIANLVLADEYKDNYKDASIKQTLVVNKIDPTITWEIADEDKTFTYGTELSDKRLKAEAKDLSGADLSGDFVYRVNDNIVTKTTLLDASDTPITINATFTPDENDNEAKNYNVKTVSVEINVAKAQQEITWDPVATIEYGTAISNEQLNAVSSSGVIPTYTYSGGDPTDKILDANNYEIFAHFAGTNNYLANEEHITITVTPANLDIEWTPQNITYGDEINSDNIKNAKVYFDNQEFTDGEFIYTTPSPLNAGDGQEITVKFAPNSRNFNNAEKKLTINVAQATPEIEWTNEQHLTYGASAEEIKTTLENAAAKFGNTTVSGNYDYTLPLTSDLQAGADNITASVEFTPTGDDANNFKPTSTVINIVVDKADPTITWEIADEDKTFTYGTGLSDKQLNATSNGVGDIVYTDNDENETVLDVDAILDAGTHTITATLPASDNYNEATATATITVNQAATEIEWETPAPIAYGIPISSVELNATANVDGTFTYELDGQNAENQTPEVGSHSIVATFTPTSNNYSGSTKTITLKVVQAAAEITWDAPEAITYGTPLSGAQLNATANVLGDFMYKPAEGSILPAGDTSISVIFIPESSDYGRATDTIKLTVNKAELSVSVADVTVNKGDAMPEFVISYNGFVNNENESVLTTAPTATCAASTDEVGAFDIIVSGGEADNYTFVYTKGTLTIVEAVAPQAPVITWAEPAAIVYGTLIDSTILNATANVKGTFKYSVNAGDALKAGTHELIATFTPDDGSEAVTSTVKLTVSKATLSVSVADATVNQGDDMPQFTIDYKGFVLNENVSNLTTAPSAKCNATTNNAGTFDIVVSGGAADNYEFQYKNGKLTVNAKEDTTAITSNMVKVLVYPNPTTDVIFVETENGTDFIYVYNMAGKLVLTEANVGKTRVDLSNEPQGTYFVKVGEKTIKVLKF